MKRFSFIDFIGLNKRPCLEAAGDKNRDVSMPIPPMVMGLLRETPSAQDRSTYAGVLRWVFTEGLFTASQKRKGLTQQANQQLKPQLDAAKLPPIPEHAMYSKEAHDFYDQHNVPLRKFYESTYGEDPYKYEPDFLDLSNSRQGNTIKVYIPKLNKKLEDDGMYPFLYGGYQGLIEYIETGKSHKGEDWAERRYPKDRFSNAHEDRTGLDVSDAHVEEDPETGEAVYKFADFHPSTTDKAWNRLAFSIMDYSHKLVERALSGEDVDIGDIVEKQAFQKFVNNPAITKSDFHGDKASLAISGKWGFYNDVNRIRDFAGEEYGNTKDYSIITFLINLTINQLIDNGQTSLAGVTEAIEEPEMLTGKEPEEMLKGNKPLFGKDYTNPDSMKVSGRYSPSKGSKPGSFSTTDTLINHGAKIAKYIYERGGMEALQQQVMDFVNGTSKMCRLLDGWKPKVNVDSIMQALKDEIITYEPTNKLNVHSVPPGKNDFDYASYVKRFKGSKEPLTARWLDDLEKMGYQFAGAELNPGDGFPAPIGKNGKPQTTARLVKRGTYPIYLSKDNGVWMMLNPPNESPEESPLAGTAFGKSHRPWIGTGPEAAVRANAGGSDKVSLKDNSRVLDDMEQDPQGYGFGMDDKKFGRSGSLNTLDDFLNAGVGQTKKYLVAYNVMKEPQVRSLDNEDIKNLLRAGLLQVSAAYQFRFGNLKDPNLLGYINKATGEDPSAAKAWIEKVRKKIQAGEPIKSISAELRQANEGVFEAFALNGKLWRLAKCVNHAVGEYKNDPDKVSGTGDMSAGEDIGPTGVAAAGHNNRLNQAKVNRIRSEETPDEIRAKVEKTLGEREAKTPFFAIGKAKYKTEKDGNDYVPFLNAYEKAHRSIELFGKSGIQRATQMLDNAANLPKPQGDADVLAVADMVHDRVQQFISSPNEVYPKDIEQFLSPDSRYYLTRHAPALVSADRVKELQNSLSQAYEQKSSSYSGSNMSPTISYVLDNDESEALHYINTPEDLDKVYPELYRSNPKAARTVYSQGKGYAPYLKILTKYGEPGLRPTADQPVERPRNTPISIRRQPMDQGQSQVAQHPNVPPQQSAPPPTAQGNQPQPNWRSIYQRPKTENTLANFRKYRLAKMRRSFLEALS